MYISFLHKFHIWSQLHLNGQTGAKTASCLKYNGNTVYCNSKSIFILPHLAYILKTIKLPVLYINKKKKNHFLDVKASAEMTPFLMNTSLIIFFMHASSCFKKEYFIFNCFCLSSSASIWAMITSSSCFFLCL